MKPNLFYLKSNVYQPSVYKPAVLNSGLQKNAIYIYESRQKIILFFD